MCGRLETFWYCQKVVPRLNGFHGTAFPAKRGTTQGIRVSPTLFNVVVGNYIRTWLVMRLEYQKVDQDRLGETVGRCVVVFCAANGMVGLRDLNWLQQSMNVHVGLFRRYGLAANVTNSHRMTCQPISFQRGCQRRPWR